MQEMNLSELLNPEQQAAVEYCSGSSVIVAGAGSGKTRVLTYKVAYLLQNGIPAYNILALTFTNKASSEMRERITKVVGWQAARALWMGTFHSIFSRILRSEAELLGFTPQFTIYDSNDSKNVVKTIIKEMALDDKKYKPSAIQQKISMAKNHLVTPAAYSASRDNFNRDNTHGIPLFGEIFTSYCRRCRECNAMDFDDLLVYTAALFRQCPDVLHRYADRFQYILVDEYQDTNIVQHDIVMQLASVHQRVCVVGDDAQSIYSFRGAEIDNILGFQRVFDNCQLFKLQQNYRSTKTIVEAANSLIAKNRNQIKKHVFSKNSDGAPIDVLCAYSDYEEASRVAQSIENVTRRHTAPYSEIAILYRTNSQSRVLEDELRKHAIPYRIYGGLSFYQRKEIKDIISYLRLTINPSDEEALIRVINTPARGIGDTTVKKVLAAAHEKTAVPILDIIGDPIAHNVNVNKGTAAKLQNFAAMIRSFVEANTVSDAYALVERVIFESGLMADATADTSIEGMSRKDNIQEFMGAVHEFCDRKVNEGDNEINIVNFLNEVALATDQDTDSNADADVVTLMTVHAAKGLEFTNVYIVGMEENLFPSMMVETERDLEEERRLFYVALTRAKECCTISYAKSRFRNGQTQYSNPSRFLYDIDARYLHLPAEMKRSSLTVDPYSGSSWGSSNRFEERETHNRYSDDYGFSAKYPSPSGSFKQQPTASPSTPSAIPSGFKPVRQSWSGGISQQTGLIAGDLVEHATFGFGKVLRIEGEGQNAKAHIAFDKHGEKTLLLKFARLTRL